MERREEATVEEAGPAGKHDTYVNKGFTGYHADR